MANRLKREKLKSISKKCLSLLEELADTMDLGFLYSSDLEDFFKLNAKDFGIKDPDEKIIKKPPQRKTGTRPPKASRKSSVDSPPAKGEIQKSTVKQNVATSIPEKKSFSSGWQRKLFKKIMLETHPDRVTSTAKNRKDEILRLDYNNLVLQTDEDAILLAVGAILELEVELPFQKQLQLLKVFELTTQKKINNTTQTFGFLWGEYNHDVQAKAKIVQEVLKMNNLPVLSEEEIILLFGKKNPKNL